MRSMMETDTPTQDRVPFAKSHRRPIALVAKTNFDVWPPVKVERSPCRLGASLPGDDV